ncbi:MAG: hypothetical protein ACFFCW_30960 [Candidatus Hodarchaeota archaeon]
MSIALLIGGVIATPIGALTTRTSPSRTLGGIIGVIVMALGASSSYVRSEALVLGLVFVVLVFIIYHFRMVGYLRLRIAMGGINVGIGTFILLWIYLKQTGAVPFYLPSPLAEFFFWGLISVGAVFIVAGILVVSINF